MMSLGHVAIIGGGRWARVLAGVTFGVAPAGVRLVLCSPSAPETWVDWLAGQPDDIRARCDVSKDMADVLRDPEVSHVVIARAAATHAQTAHAALDAGKKVFIEKPFATDLPSAQALAHRVKNHPQDAMTGLVFRYAENLRRFAAACAARGRVARIVLAWGDAPAEVRHGARKTHDPTLNVAWDVFPHVWSILRLIAPAGPLGLSDARWVDGGDGITAALSIGDIAVDVTMTRRADIRTRRIVVEGAGWSGNIDFAVEPGTATIDGAPIDVATAFSSPLSREIAAFLGAGADPIHPACLLPNALEALSMASEITARLAATR